MVLNLGFSPCPNDTYIFDAIVNKRIDLKGYSFDVQTADVEKLNKNAFEQILDITKLSFNAFAYVSENYQILNSGAALGFANGPLLISKRKIYSDEVPYIKIAIPGKYTTANMLLNIFWQPQKNNVHEYLFSDIEDAIQSNEVDAGLVIHETRFTYKKRGLLKIADLGEMWEKENNLPLPLGAIAIKRNLSQNIKTDISQIIRDSIEFANKNPEASKQYIKQSAQETSEEVTKQHINLYVNKYSVDLGNDGKSAINQFYKLGNSKNVCPKVVEPIFI